MTQQERNNILDGARVRVVHLRNADMGIINWQPLPGQLTAHQLRERGLRPAAKGGTTLVEIEFADGNFSRTFARCSPRDNYCKATGRMIAVGRAVKFYAECV
jgi:hypothetical protein